MSTDSRTGMSDSLPPLPESLELKGVYPGKGSVTYECVRSATGAVSVTQYKMMGSQVVVKDWNDRVVGKFKSSVIPWRLDGGFDVTFTSEATKKPFFQGEAREYGLRQQNLDPWRMRSKSDGRVAFQVNNKGGKFLTQSCNDIGERHYEPLETEFWFFDKPQARGVAGLPDSDVKVVCEPQPGLRRTAT